MFMRWKILYFFSVLLRVIKSVLSVNLHVAQRLSFIKKKKKPFGLAFCLLFFLYVVYNMNVFRSSVSYHWDFGNRLSTPLWSDTFNIWKFLRTMSWTGLKISTGPLVMTTWKWLGPVRARGLLVRLTSWYFSRCRCSEEWKRRVWRGRW